MGKIRVFEIQYENRQSVFHSGARVTGAVLLEADGTVQAQSLIITVIGEGKVHWAKRSEGVRGHFLAQNNRSVKHYRSQEVYVNKGATLLQPERGNSKVSLSPGHYRYNFEFQLPATCPSSFEGSHGYVRYWCKASLSRPWKFDVETKSACTVLSQYDLNMEPLLSHPARWDLYHNVSFCCCSLGKVDIALNINKTGFVPGESIMITGKVTNYTNRSIPPPKLKLQQIVEYRGFSDAMFSSGRPKSQSDAQIVKQQHARGGPLYPGHTQDWHELFTVPPLPPTGLKGASYIDIKYSIKVSIKPPFADKITWWRPITIGTLPIQIRRSDTSRYETTLQPALSVTLPPTSMATPPAPPLPDLPVSVMESPPAYSVEDMRMPPPSYEESIQGKVDILEAGDSEFLRGNLKFVPSYTYYDLQGCAQSPGQSPGQPGCER